MSGEVKLKKPNDKIGVTTPYKSEAQQRAWELYVARRGKITQRELASEIGVSRASIIRWMAGGDWKMEMEKITRYSASLATAKIAESLAEKVKDSLDKDLMTLDIIGQMLTIKFFVLDPVTGTPKIGTNGKPLMRSDLSPNDIRTLAEAYSTLIKSKRLLTGDSTENNAIMQRGKMEHNITITSPNSDKASQEQLSEFIRNGGQDAQRLIYKIIGGDLIDQEVLADADNEQ